MELYSSQLHLITHMDVRDHHRSYLRPAVLVVILLLHGSLIVVLLRAKPAYKVPPAAALSSTIFLIVSDRRVSLPPPDTSVMTRLSRKDLRPPVRSDLSIPAVGTTSPLENQALAAPPTIDWSAEAQHSAAEIVGRTEPDRSAVSPSAPAAPAPWDPDAQRLKATGHGLKLRIIDQCFAVLDLGQTVYGAEGRLQLGCNLKKKPPIGDLFDSLQKPKPNE